MRRSVAPSSPPTRGDTLLSATWVGPPPSLSLSTPLGIVVHNTQTGRRVVGHDLALQYFHLISEDLVPPTLSTP